MNGLSIVHPGAMHDWGSDDCHELVIITVRDTLHGPSEVSVNRMIPSHKVHSGSYIERLLLYTTVLSLCKIKGCLSVHVSC